MKVLQEITDWDVEYRQPNHTYLFDGEKAIAYRKWHEGEAEFFKNGYRIDKRYRKFKEIAYDPKVWGEQKNDTNIVVVEGSKGNTYDVDVEAEKCSCPGFTYRGQCKHIELAKSRLALAA